MESRLQHLIQLFQYINNDNSLDGGYQVKGTSLLKLSQFDSPAYRRVRDWAEKKAEEKRNTLQIPLDTNHMNDDMLRAEKEFQKCFDLMQSRNTKYGDSWKVLTIPSLANLCEMKLHRISNMDMKNLDPKIEDELRDTANYMIFALMKLEK